jgi:hypothetical protein
MNYQSEETVDVSYNLWPRYTSSQVFFSSIMDFLMAQSYHTESIVDIIGKLITKICLSISETIENSEINTIEIPHKFSNDYTYEQIF